MPLFSKRDLLIGQTGIAHIFLIILLVVGIGLGIFLVKNNTNFLPHASSLFPASPETSFILESDKNSAKIGEEFKVKVFVRSDFDGANLFKAAISYPSDKLEVVNIQTSESTLSVSNDNQNTISSFISTALNSLFTEASAQSSNSPTGFIDNIDSSNCSVIGWAKDDNSPNTVLNIHIYKDGEAGKGGTYITQGKADIQRGDGLLGFNIPLPSGFSGDVYAHALGVNSSGVEDGGQLGLPTYTQTVSSRRIVCTSSQSNNPTGYVDTIDKTACTVSGWAKDDNSLSTPLDIHIYKDGEAGKGGTYITQGKANTDRSDGLKGFTVSLPPNFSGDIYAYALGVNAAGQQDRNNSLLPLYNPTVPTKSLTCSPPPAPTPPTAPAGSPFEFIGSPEIVFNWTTDKCSPTNVPDLPARAYRSADGKVNLTLSMDNENRRMRGDSLNTVRADCSVNFGSGNDQDFSHHSYHEWIASPYTEDGTTVYGLLHNEWYGFLSNPACNSNQRADGWVNSLTLVSSNNGGASYSRPADYLVRIPQTPWSNSFGCAPGNRTQYGSFTPSNIIKRDNYYYAFFHDITSPTTTPNKDGICLMRTQNLSNASSWEVYTDNGFIQSKNVSCKTVLSGMAPDSVTFNSYLNKYVMTGLNWGMKSLSMSESDDLLRWSAPIKMMDAPPSSDGWWQRAYPSLLDPNSGSRNFETTGQDAYLYYMEYRGGWYRDLLRQKIRFTKPGVSVSSNLNYFITNWTEKSDNRNGKISLSGTVSNPGFKTEAGKKGLMATITFKTKNGGEANLVFDRALTGIYRTSDNQNIMSVARGVKVQIDEAMSSVSPSSSARPSATPRSSDNRRGGVYMGPRNPSSINNPNSSNFNSR